MVLKVAAAIATVVAGVTPVPTPDGCVAASAITAGLASAGSVHASPQTGGRTVELGADTVDGVLMRMVDAVILIGTVVTDGERGIADALDRGYAEMTGPGRGALLPRRPGVVERSRSGDGMGGFTPR